MNLPDRVWVSRTHSSPSHQPRYHGKPDCRTLVKSRRIRIKERAMAELQGKQPCHWCFPETLMPIAA